MKWLFLMILLSGLITKAAGEPVKIVILGDSITEGFGVPKDLAYPALLEKKLKDGGHKNIEVINSGISGSTSASGASRLSWILKSNPKIIIVALGANDGLRGLKPKDTENNLKTTIELAKKNHVTVILAGMKMPPNYGKSYTHEFESLFVKLARKEKILLIPFLLQGVAGISSLNQGDGIHPNEKGHTIIAETVKNFIEPLL